MEQNLILAENYDSDYLNVRICGYFLVIQITNYDQEVVHEKSGLITEQMGV